MEIRCLGLKRSWILKVANVRLMYCTSTGKAGGENIWHFGALKSFNRFSQTFRIQCPGRIRQHSQSVAWTHWKPKALLVHSWQFSQRLPGKIHQNMAREWAKTWHNAADEAAYLGESQTWRPPMGLGGVQPRGVPQQLTQRMGPARTNRPGQGNREDIQVVTHLLRVTGTALGQNEATPLVQRLRFRWGSKNRWNRPNALLVVEQSNW